MLAQVNDLRLFLEMILSVLLPSDLFAMIGSSLEIESLLDGIVCLQTQTSIKLQEKMVQNQRGMDRSLLETIRG